MFYYLAQPGVKSPRVANDPQGHCVTLKGNVVVTDHIAAVYGSHIHVFYRFTISLFAKRSLTE